MNRFTEFLRFGLTHSSTRNDPDPEGDRTAMVAFGGSVLLGFIAALIFLLV